MSTVLGTTDIVAADNTPPDSAAERSELNCLRKRLKTMSQRKVTAEVDASGTSLIDRLERFWGRFRRTWTRSQAHWGRRADFWTSAEMHAYLSPETPSPDLILFPPGGQEGRIVSGSAGKLRKKFRTSRELAVKAFSETARTKLKDAQAFNLAFASVLDRQAPSNLLN